MTNKIQRTAGANFETLIVGEKTYRLTPLRFGIYGEMEAYVSSLRADPIEIAARSSASLTAIQSQQLWDAAIRAATFAKIVPASEMANFEKSITGISWKLWKCLETNHPEIESPADAAKILTQAGAERLAEIKAKIVVASGEDDLKK